MSFYRNKSALEREKELPFLIARDGSCCTKKYGFGCGRTFNELNMEEERVRRMTGKSRKSPIVQIDHINGISTQRDGPKGEYCGNEQILCTPCHIRKTVNQKANNRAKNLVQNTQPSSMEMAKNLRSEPSWLKEVVNFIHDNHSMCLSLVRYGFEKLSDLTTNRYLKKRLVSKEKDVDPMFELGWGRCDSALCNGVHVYFYGNAPVSEEPDKPNLEV